MTTTSLSVVETALSVGLFLDDVDLVLPELADAFLPDIKENIAKRALACGLGVVGAPFLGEISPAKQEHNQLSHKSNQSRFLSVVQWHSSLKNMHTIIAIFTTHLPVGFTGTIPLADGGSASDFRYEANKLRRCRDCGKVVTV